MRLKEVDANLLVTLDALLVDASVTRAAERLGRSASAISHALAKLREIFDDELFVRAGQRLVPTAKALELAPTVHVILAGMESLLRPSNPFDPSLSVREFAAASSEAGELILVEPLRKRLESAAPNVHVNWAPSHRDETVDALRTARRHFVIDIEGALVNAPDVRVAKLFDDTLATLARPGHAFTKRKPDAATFVAAFGWFCNQRGHGQCKKQCDKYGKFHLLSSLGCRGYFRCAQCTPPLVINYGENVEFGDIACPD